MIKSVQLSNPTERLINKKKAEMMEKISRGNIDILLHELHTYQVELEIQNEELKRAKKEIEISRNKYADLYDFAPNGYFTFDGEGFIQEVNLSGSKMLGVSRDFLVNKMFHIYVVPDCWDIFNEFYKRVISEDIKQTCEIQMRNKDGQIFFAQLEGIKVLEKEKAKQYCRAAVIDITDRKQTEEELRKNTHELLFNKKLLERKSVELAQVFINLAKSERNLSEMNLNKDKFFAIISHDLRSPFSVMLGLINILITDFDRMNYDKIKEIHQKLGHSANTIYSLLNNLLKWSVIQFGKNDYKFEQISLNDLVKNTMNLLEEYAKNKRIQIKPVLNKNLKVMADKTMLESIIQNLLTNAIKYSPKGGKVFIEAVEKEKHTEISVIDTGEGLDKKTIDQLFRIDKKNCTKGTSDEQGTGLGLILCKAMVETQGGKIWAESEFGKGGKFTFSLPRNNNNIIKQTKKNQ